MVATCKVDLVVRSSYTVKNSCGLKSSSTEAHFIETGFAEVTPFHGGIPSCEAIAVIYTVCK